MDWLWADGPDQPDKKGVDTPFEADWNTLAGLVLVVLVGSVANTAGVGGGAIFVPIFQALVGFGLKESTALSQALITAGSAVTLLLNIFSPNPVDPRKPLIDFPLVLLLLPVLLVGVGAGVLLNVVMPPYVISSLLFLIMCLLTTQSLSKGIHMWRHESKQRRTARLHRPEGGSSFRAPSMTRAPSLKRTSHARASFGRNSFNARGDAAVKLLPTVEDEEIALPPAPTPAPAPPRSSYRPLGAASLPVLHAADEAEDTWFSRRNAWLVRMVRACNELGPEPSFLTRDAPSWGEPSDEGDGEFGEDGGEGEGEGEEGEGDVEAGDASVGVGGAGGRASRTSSGGYNRAISGVSGGASTPSSRVSGGGGGARRLMRRFSSTDHEEFFRHSLFEPLLSPKDQAAARHPRAARLPPEQWDATAGRSEEELLQALSGDLGRVSERSQGQGAAPAGAAAGAGPGTEGARQGGAHGADLGAAAAGAPAVGAPAVGTPAVGAAAAVKGSVDDLCDLQDLARAEGGSPRGGAVTLRLPAGNGSQSIARQDTAEAAEKVAPAPRGGPGSGWGEEGAGGLTQPLLAGQEAEDLAQGRPDGPPLPRAPSRRSQSLAPGPGAPLPRCRSRREQWRQQHHGVHVRSEAGQRLRHWLHRTGGHISRGWSRVPKLELSVLIICWGVFVVLQLGRNLGPTCSAAYWGFFAAQLVIMPLFSVVAAWVESRRTRTLEKVEEAHARGDEREREALEADGCARSVSDVRSEQGERSLLGSFLTYQVLALTAGVAGGMLGMGGGMIIGPVLLELGVQPQVGSATSSVMVLFSSSTALISLSALGMLNTDYATVFAAASMFASVFGALVLGRLIKRTGRVSLVVLALAVVMVIGAVAVGGFGITIILDTIRTGRYGFARLCAV